MRPTYIETSDSDCADAWLERYGRRLPLMRIGEEGVAASPVHPAVPAVAAVQAAHAALPDKRTRKTIAAVAKASAAVAAVQPALRDAKTIAAIDNAMAAFGRGGGPVIVSSYPMSQAEVDQYSRDLPRLSPADEAAFAAAARDFARFSQCFPEDDQPCPASK